MTRRRIPFWRLGGVVAGLLAVATLTSSQGTAASPPPMKTAPAAPASPTWVVDPVEQATVARPVRLRIPAIGVSSSIVDIGVDASGALVPPRDFDVTGWFTGGVAPGAVGPALLAGHVDSRNGPAVFFRLRDLRPGDIVAVDRADGTSVSFTVASTTRVAKTAFPTSLVYAPVPVAALRLVTCGGSFDHAARSYRDNIIVDAT